MVWVWSACPHSHRCMSEIPVLFRWALRPQCSVRRRKIVVCWARFSLQIGSRCAWYPPFSLFQSPLCREGRSVLASLSNVKLLVGLSLERSASPSPDPSTSVVFQSSNCNLLVCLHLERRCSILGSPAVEADTLPPRHRGGRQVALWDFIILSYLFRSLADRWGTTVDFTTSFFHSSRFSAFRSMIFHLRPVHSLMLSSHRFLCLPLHLPP